MDKKRITDGIHFLTFEQIHFMGVECGPTEMYYVASVFHMRIFKVYKDNVSSMDIEFTRDTVREQLREFLMEFYSMPYLFLGRPEYVESDMFSEDEFNHILQEANDRTEAVRKKSLRQKSPLLELCREYGLDPEPAGHKETSFYAKCVTGRPHQMYLSTESEAWGCGFCKIKGGVEELKAAYQQYRGR
ncbi:MAG: hypothetical protein KFF73_08550 [Cyclobacteriaceae bacterium]|nr:hypothetical protein [Cyclobacteriaceae bacterium]